MRNSALSLRRLLSRTLSSFAPRMPPRGQEGGSYALEEVLRKCRRNESACALCFRRLQGLVLAADIQGAARQVAGKGPSRFWMTPLCTGRGCRASDARLSALDLGAHSRSSGLSFESTFFHFGWRAGCSPKVINKLPSQRRKGTASLAPSCSEMESAEQSHYQLQEG